MGKEFEIKFKATPDQLAAIEAEYGCFSLFSMETTYYDAVDSSLSARHITLRRRMENGSAVCTVKTPLDGLGRGEWETECDRIEDAIPILCKLGCGEDLISLTACGIIPVCGARFTRLAGTLNTEGCTVELALDRGVLLGGGREVPLCEVEVELKAGSEEDALLFAQRLAVKYGLTQENRSKFRRALELAKES
jgi:inorganic triphosphatase YgiF